MADDVARLDRVAAGLAPVARHQAGVGEGRDGVLLGLVDDVGHVHGGGARGDDVGDLGAAGQLGRGGRVGGDDVARLDRVAAGLAPVARHQAGVGEGRDGVLLGLVDDVGHGHGGGARGDDVGDLGAAGQLGRGGRVGGDDVARLDRVAAGLAPVARHQAGVGEGRDGVLLGLVDDVGHGHGGGARGDDVGDLGAAGQLGRGGRVGGDDVARLDRVAAGLAPVARHQAGVGEGRDGVLLGLVDDVGHGHGGGARGDDVGDLGAAGQLGRGGRVGGDDVARLDRVAAGLAPVARHQAGVGEGRDGVLLGLVDDVGHGHGGGARGDDVGDLGAAGRARSRGPGRWLMTLPGCDRVAAGLAPVARRQAGVGEGRDGVLLGLVDDVGHGHGGGARGDDVGDLGAAGELGRGGRVGGR